MLNSLLATGISSKQTWERKTSGGVMAVPLSAIGIYQSTRYDEDGKDTIQTNEPPLKHDGDRHYGFPLEVNITQESHTAVSQSQILHAVYVIISVMVSNIDFRIHRSLSLSNQRYYLRWSYGIQ